MKNYYPGFKLRVQITKEKGHYVAWAPALDLSTSGRSEQEARRRFKEAVSLFLVDLVSAGTVDEVLASLGWKKEPKFWSPPKIVKQQTVKVNIPPSGDQ